MGSHHKLNEQEGDSALYGNTHPASSLVIRAKSRVGEKRTGLDKESTVEHKPSLWTVQQLDESSKFISTSTWRTSLGPRVNWWSRYDGI